jgi:hypothetical protein
MIAIGTRGYRLLDGVRFACEVVEYQQDDHTLSVRFNDDQTVESGVEIDEFTSESPEL